ncbi:MAG: hypothetical protein WC693_02475, partial [Patescibacteria group bacterium]
MFKRAFPFGALLLLIAAILFVAPGCDREGVTEPVDEAIVDQPVDDEILTAEEINAIGREQHKLFLESGGTLPQHDGDKAWQLYVNVPFYSQLDYHWSSNGLGFNYDGGSTIGGFGCHLCCISMLYAKWSYGSETNPPNLNNWVVEGRQHYAFATSGNGDLIRLPQALEYGSMSRPWYTISASQIYGELQRGRPVIVRITYGGSHFMV